MYRLTVVYDEPADKEAFDTYVRERWVPLLRTATLLTGDRHAAEDLVQETLVRAAQHWARVEPATADAYVRRILYTRSVDAWRWRRHQPDPVDVASHPSRRTGWRSRRMPSRPASRSPRRWPGSPPGSGPCSWPGSTRTEPRSTPPACSAAR